MSQRSNEELLERYEAGLSIYQSDKARLGRLIAAAYANKQAHKRIMQMSEEELIAELAKDGETLESAAAKGRAAFERAKAIVDGPPLPAGVREP